MNLPEFTSLNYKRSQVDWTLWEAAHWRQVMQPPAEISTEFRHRIKRLLDLDTVILGEKTGSIHAFSEVVPGGHGVDRQFSLLDIFNLGIALQLIDTGFNQKEVVFLLQHIRGFLERHLPKLSIYPICKSEKAASKEKFPKLPEALNGQYADTRVFLAITKIEMSEIYATTYGTEGPAILAPKICWGVRELATFIDKEAYRYPNHIIVEIGQLCALVRNEISNAPVTKRGRKADPSKKGIRNG